MGTVSGMVDALEWLAGTVSQIRARAKGLAVLARGAGYPFPRPFARRVTTSRVRLAPGVEGDLYTSDVGAPGLMLVPGGAPRGSEDPALIRLARSFAGARRRVFVPELELSRQTFVWSDIEALRAAIVALARTDGSGRTPSVGVLGLSYGGSFALLAAEDPDVAAALSFVATFGSYVDVLSIIRGITTGATLVDGCAVPWKAAPEAPGILARAAAELISADRRHALSRALMEHDATGLDAEARAVFDLLENRDPRRTAELATRLPAAMRETIARFSPEPELRSLRVPLFILQSVDDPATPPTEAERMHAAVPGSRLAMLGYFQHVRPGGAGAPLRGRLRDLARSWSFVSWVLGAQE